MRTKSVYIIELYRAVCEERTEAEEIFEQRLYFT